MQEKSKTTCTAKQIKTTACQNIKSKRNLDLKLEPDMDLNLLEAKYFRI